MNVAVRVLLFVLHLVVFLLVSVVFLPILFIANYGSGLYEKWWEKITSF